MAELQPEITAEHITVNDGDVLVFTVKNGTNKIGTCKINGKKEELYCLYAYDEPVLTFSGNPDDKYGDKIFTEYGSLLTIAAVNNAIENAYEQLCQGAAIEYVIPQILRMMSDGLYAVSYQKCYPTTGENMFFWSGFGVPKQLKNSSRYIKLIDEDKTYSAPFILASKKSAAFDSSRIKKAAKFEKRGDDLIGISLHISGFYSLLLKGHFSATAALLTDKPFYTIQIQPVRDIWNAPDESGKQVAVGLCSSSFKIPFSALSKEQIKIALSARAISYPDTYSLIKKKLDTVKTQSLKALPPQLNRFCESYPDADMIAGAQGVNELTKPMLNALLMGATTLEDKIIISDNYYQSVTAACNYLRYHNQNDFISFALDIMKNPELSATYSYVAGCMAKVNDSRVKAFFEQIVSTNDTGYSSILSLAKSYLMHSETDEEVSREDYYASLPEPTEREVAKMTKFIPLSEATKRIKDGEGAELVAKHVSKMINDGTLNADNVKQ